LIEVAAVVCEVDEEELGGEVGVWRAFALFRAALIGLGSNADEVPEESAFDRGVLLNLSRAPFTTSGVNMGNEGAASIWADWMAPNPIQLDGKAVHPQLSTALYSLVADVKRRRLFDGPCSVVAGRGSLK
jgi:hypothetical protein